MRDNYQHFNWNNYDYQGQLSRYRYQAGDWAQNKTLALHDSTYALLKYKDISSMWFFRRPQAYFHNIVLEQMQKVTRPAIEYAGTGLGHALDKTAVRTWESVNPINFSYIYTHPARTKLYFSQRGNNIKRYADAIDRRSYIQTILNLKSIWVQNVSNTYTIQKYLWDNKLYSPAPFYRPTSILVDKSQHLALSYYDLMTDRVAEIIGWSLISATAFRLPKQARGRTQNATNLWVKRLRLGYMPITINLPIKMFMIRPTVRVLYNPWILGSIVTYKLLSNLGQNVRDSEYLEQNEPGLYQILGNQGKSTTRASRYRDQSESINARNSSNRII